MIKEQQVPSICSECGTALVYSLHKNHPNKLFLGWYGYDPDLRKCTKCGYISDISLRRSEDEKHNLYHQTGKDPSGGRFNYSENKWESKE